MGRYDWKKAPLRADSNYYYISVYVSSKNVDIYDRYHRGREHANPIRSCQPQPLSWAVVNYAWACIKKAKQRALRAYLNVSIWGDIVCLTNKCNFPVRLYGASFAECRVQTLVVVSGSKLDFRDIQSLCVCNRNWVNNRSWCETGLKLVSVYNLVDVILALHLLQRFGLAHPDNEVRVDGRRIQLNLLRGKVDHDMETGLWHTCFVMDGYCCRTNKKEKVPQL